MTNPHHTRNFLLEVSARFGAIAADIVLALVLMKVWVVYGLSLVIHRYLTRQSLTPQKRCARLHSAMNERFREPPLLLQREDGDSAASSDKLTPILENFSELISQFTVFDNPEDFASSIQRFTANLSAEEKRALAERLQSNTREILRTQRLEREQLLTSLHSETEELEKKIRELVAPFGIQFDLTSVS